MGTKIVKGPFSWTDSLGPVWLTEPQSIFVEPYPRLSRGGAMIPIYGKDKHFPMWNDSQVEPKGFLMGPMKT